MCLFGFELIVRTSLQMAHKDVSGHISVWNKTQQHGRTSDIINHLWVQISPQFPNRVTNSLIKWSVWLLAQVLQENLKRGNLYHNTACFIIQTQL